MRSLIHGTEHIEEAEQTIAINNLEEFLNSKKSPEGHDAKINGYISQVHFELGEWMFCQQKYTEAECHFLHTKKFYPKDAKDITNQW